MTGEEQGDRRDPSESVLEELLAELERAGGEFDLVGFEARHPGHETLIARWLKSVHALEGLKPAGSPQPASASSIAPGTVMGDFVVESLIARGGMGVVYRARQQSLGGREVALKVLPLEGVSPKSQERFRREARAAAEVHHPNLAAVYGFGADEGILFYAMQLVEGPSLRDVLADLAQRREQSQAQPECRKLVFWTRDVAAALDALHRRGLVHRDVKPSNIMLAHAAETPGEWPDAPALLVDFGLVRRVDSHTLTEGSVSAATPSYAAPEQLIGIEVDARVDVFGLGVTLHDLLSARLPSERLQAAAGIEPIESLAPGIDRDLAAIVGKATDPKPEWRYASAGALLEDLNAWLDGRPVSARRMGVIERAQRYTRRHPQRAALSAVLALAVVLLALVAGKVSRSITAARNAREGFARGELLHTSEDLLEVPAPFAFLLGDDALRQMRRDVVERGGSPDQPVPPWLHIVGQLEAKDPEAALVEAATEIEAVHVGSNPLLERFLLKVMAGEQLAERRGMAILLTARLFVETPDWKPEAVQQSAPFRELIRKLLETDTVAAPTGIDRLYLVSALAGCGTPTEIPLILKVMHLDGKSEEEQRLGVFVIGLILRRAIPCRADLAPAMHALQDNLLPFSRRLLKDRRKVLRQDRNRVWIGVAEALIAWGLAARGAKLEPPLDALEVAFPVDQASMEAAEPYVWEILAASGHPRMEKLLLETDIFTRHRDLISDWGGMCALLDQSAVTSAAEKVCASLTDVKGETSGDRTTHFKESCATFAQRWHGVWEGNVLDSDSLLVPGEGPRAVGDWGEPLPKALHAHYSDSNSIALWDFTLERPYLWGTARSASALGADLRQATYRYLRMFRGDSEATLECDLSLEDASQPLDLVIHHQKASRDVFPLSGVAEVSIALDDAIVHSFRITDTSDTETRVPLSPFDIEPGTRKFTVRLRPTSTSTYRFLRARLERRAPATDTIGQSIWYRWPASLVRLLLQQFKRLPTLWQTK